MLVPPSVVRAHPAPRILRGTGGHLRSNHNNNRNQVNNNHNLPTTPLIQQQTIGFLGDLTIRIQLRAIVTANFGEYRIFQKKSGEPKRQTNR